jgi:hypothetical protein
LGIPSWEWTTLPQPVPDQRPPVPRPLLREVLVEAGHRCAIPTCRATTTEIAHIVPWSKVREHTFGNLIALCPNCHSRFDKGDIDRQSMLAYKRNLGLVSSRYGDAERRLLDLFVRHPEMSVAAFDKSMDFEFLYLVQDGLLAKAPRESGLVIAGIRQGPVKYVITPTGVKFVEQLREGSSVEDTE